MIIIILYKTTTNNSYMFKLIQYFNYIKLFTFKLCNLLVHHTSKYISNRIKTWKKKLPSLSKKIKLSGNYHL